MIRFLPPGALACALLALAGAAAAAARSEAPAWLVTPAQDSCTTEIDLAGPSGASVPVQLVSDGDTVQLVYPKAEAPERAFLPIRVDHKAFANLVLRQADGKTAAMHLSPETLAALRKGGTLQIGWLADEPVQSPLAGSEQGLSDLRTCGAQVSSRYHAQQALEREAAEHAQADARAKALADEQLAAARAQKAAAEAEAERNQAEAERLKAAAAEADQRQQAQADEERQHAAYQAQREGFGYPGADDEPAYERGGYPRGSEDPRDRYPSPPIPYGRW